LPWQDAPQFLADPTSVRPLQPLVRLLPDG
jgi:hypothetical protein